MAQQLKEFAFTRGRDAHYSWDLWTDGSIWKLKQGEDFTTPPHAFASAARGKAVRMGARIHVSIQGNTVILQFVAKET